ncbi:uncharacterized protein LOC125241727 [Leguminivora glycinivorella]|uniref:uncharacterized protein LOC125241727 n=1 Tax=Leguminivora glycinivorella TaxID=1035111 RepID=UPI00201004CC|nr:uncharacterized protein LOC125241727 [Leguminivora glycinivorella]
MAEESKPNQSKPKSYENGWIVCRSQKRPGLLYDFNTLTGEAQWRDPDKSDTTIVDKNKVPFDCHEPTEPPMEPKLHKQPKVTQSSSAPNIYNKQIINNQFPAKPFAIAPFGNSACAPYGLIDPNNSMNVNTMSATPAVWVTAPPTPQVLLGASVTPLNQLIAYGGLDNIQLQNSSLTLSNRFQVLNQLNTGSPLGMNMQHEDTSNHESYSYQQPHQNYNKPCHKNNHQRPVISNLNRHTDLRSKLSSRKRQDLEAKPHATKVAEKPVVKKEEALVIMTEDELNPDDNDEWLQAHTDGEGKQLNMDIESFWELADSGISCDYCYIIPTTRVLLNNMRFLNSLVVSDDRLRLLTPRDVVRSLRSAAFSCHSRLADYASRARTFAIRQMRKIPDNLKDARNVKSCLELIAPNIHVVLLVEEKDMLNLESINDGTITVAELKRYLTRNSAPKATPVPGMQTFCENIKITVPNVEPKSSPRIAEPEPQTQVPNSPSKSNATTNSTTLESPKLDTEKSGLKEIQIQTDIVPPPVKRTANACVQTDDIIEPWIGIKSSKYINCGTSIAGNDLCDTEKQNYLNENKTIEVTNNTSRNANAANYMCNKQTNFNREAVNGENNLCNEQTNFNKNKAVDAANTAITLSDKQTNLITNETSKVVNAANHLCDDQTNLKFASSEIGHKEIKTRSIENTAKASNDNKATSAAPRRIKLKRLQNSNPTASTEGKQSFKWRRKKNTQQTTGTDHELGGTSSSNISTKSSTSNLVQQMYDFTECKFSDVSAEMVDGSSTSGVLSNSVYSDKLPMQKDLNPDRSIVVYEVTSDSMTERLTLRSDEWMSRFVQIMEEVLSEVLLLDPPFVDATLPPPWTFYEATVCVKQKFANDAKIVYASDKLAKFLLDINDDRGNLVSTLSPTDFMEMYTFGVNLVNKLKSVLKDCEDVHIASQNLSQLLSEIREPNLDESYDMETFNLDDPSHSPSFSEAVTDMSTIISGFPPMQVNNKSPKNKEKILSSNNSPARYSLRSTRSEQKKKEAEPQADVVSNENPKYTLFSSLGLQKKDIQLDTNIIKTIINYPKDQQPKPPTPLSSPTPEASEIAQVAKPKIVRNFNICPEWEKRLKDKVCNNATDNDDDHFPSVEVDNVAENYMPEDVGFAEDVDFTEDGFTINEPYCEGLSETMNMDVDLNYKRIQSPNAESKLKLVIRRITYKYRRWLIDLQTFCEATNAAIKSPDYQQHEYQANVMEKITKVGEHANSVCRRLKCILKRDPNVTRNKYCDMLKSYGIIDFNVSESQMDDYRGEIEKYLELAERLLTCVSRLAEAAKAK